MTAPDELTISPNGPDFETAINRLLEEPKLADDITERAIGPTVHCFSIHRLVNLFRWGADKPDVAHLALCPHCRKWANSYAMSGSAQAAQEKSMAKPWKEQVASWFGKSQPSIVPARPMLHVKGDVVHVGKPGLFVEVALVAGVGERPLDQASLKLEGGLSSDKGTVLLQEIEGVNCAVVRFENLTLSDSLQREVRNHATVVQNVAVVGKFLGDDGLSFRGLANVHIGAAGQA
jgi:hypothetical protein